MKKRLTFNQYKELILFNEDLSDLQNKAQKILNQLTKTQAQSDSIKELIETLDNLINFDLIDSIHNASE